MLDSALERHRETIRALRDLSFNLEPVVLRDQGFAPAVRAFAEQVGLSYEMQVDLDVEAADGLAEKAQVALYQIDPRRAQPGDQARAALANLDQRRRA